LGFFLIPPTSSNIGGGKGHGWKKYWQAWGNLILVIPKYSILGSGRISRIEFPGLCASV
jgi:hypothetical protein